MSFHRKSANSAGHKKQFSQTAQKVHKKNINSGPMRGGIRL